MLSEKLYRNTLNLMLAWLSFTKLFVYVQFTVSVYRLIFPSTGIPKRKIRLIFVLRTTALGSKYFFFFRQNRTDKHYSFCFLWREHPGRLITYSKFLPAINNHNFAVYTNCSKTVPCSLVFLTLKLVAKRLQHIGHIKLLLS